jgi:hypothetical protein
MKKGFYLLMICFILGGCQSLEHTTRWYQVKTLNPLPSKPPDFVVPILNTNQTRRAYKVIGEMEFASGRSDSFILDAVAYNARIHGADAVILKEWAKDEEIYIDWYPLGFHHYSPYRYGCDTGYAYYHNFSYDYTLDTYTVNSVRAEMVVFMDHDTFGFLGLIFEDVRNAAYLEIAHVLPGSPAAEAGLQRGDKVRRIGDYLCNQGLAHYHQEGPLARIGETMEVELHEESGSRVTTLTGRALSHQAS